MPNVDSAHYPLRDERRVGEGQEEGGDEMRLLSAARRRSTDDDCSTLSHSLLLDSTLAEPVTGHEILVLAAAELMPQVVQR